METVELFKLHVAQLHHAEFGQFIIRLFEDLGKASFSVDTDPSVKALLSELKGKIPTYNKALEQVVANEESARIAELDRRRDADVQALKDSIKPYRNAKIAAQVQAYTALKIVLDEYKDVEKEVYEEETHKINGLLSTLQSGNYKTAVQTLKVEDFVAGLGQSNREFNDLFAIRSSQILSKESYDVKSLRRELLETYRKLCNYVLSMAEVRQEKFYVKMLEIINNSRRYYADVQAARAGRNKKEEEPNAG